MPQPLASRAENEEAWFAARRAGFTASDANRVLTPSGRRAILAEKVTGERPSLGNIPAVAWGKAREAAVMAWVTERFGIPANDAVWAGENPRHLATPDGLSFDGGPGGTGCEVKCSGHPMDAGEYQAQIQWQMHVFGVDEWLLVWEQHDGNYPEPKPLGEPTWMWIERDQALIDTLVKEADALLAEADIASPADLEPLILDETDEIGYYAKEVLAGREIEAEGKAQKEAAWAKLLALLANHPDSQWRADYAQITWSTTPGRPTLVVDRDAMEQKAPAVVAKYRDLEKRFTTEVPGKDARKLTITRKDA